MVKILAFDTETNTMLIRDKNSKKLLSFFDYKNKNSLWSTYINICPSIIQLSYILYDTNNSSSAKIFNKYIDIPDNIIITKETIKIHHITRETILNATNVNKAKIDDALNEFMNDFSKADVVGIIASSICIIHCVLTPLIVIVFSEVIKEKYELLVSKK